ncbi:MULTISPECIES: hypothetical protein [unclassified Cedecea]|uniref:hypothetical protein n=1 Tax=unclassified Cedecea TaxID=2649846 RepID=UPI003017A15E
METGGQAFPIFDSYRSERIADGMTLRDYFAAKALHGWLSSYGEGDRHPVLNETADQVASMSYAMADAMLKARSAHN